MAIIYQPVVHAASGPYRGAALVGTHSAVIGWTFDDLALRDNLLGFAIRRTDLDPETGEVMRLDWLGGFKRFADSDYGRADDVDSLEAPFQRFRWNDYTLKSTRAYRYEVFPMRGSSAALTRDEAPLLFELRPSQEDPGDLGVFVNRGVTAAMAYLARFRNQHPSEVGPAAYHWLSRGLKESLLGFIAAAEPGDALHVAIYEFFDHEIAQAFKDAVNRQVDVRIVHDAKPGKHSTEENEEVIHHFGLEDVRAKRTTVNISHNKIVIRLVNGAAQEVWTGSANFSKASCNDNDENAMLITGNKRLPSILATEFMRMYDHYKSRYYIDRFNDKNKAIKKENKQRKTQGLDPKPLKKMDIHLKTDKNWSRTAFDPGSSSHKFRDRIVFAGG